MWTFAHPNPGQQMPVRGVDRVHLPMVAASQPKHSSIGGDSAHVGAASAAGTFDGYFELNLNTWDVAAGAALVLEVGGRVSDWSGGDSWVESGNIFAAAPEVHEVLLALASAPQK